MKRNLIGMMLLVMSVGSFAGIELSKHDLRAGIVGTVGSNKVTGAKEICAFCHTSHGAATANAPLWQRTLTTTGYTTYASSTMDGSASTPGNISLACLTCHDGTQSMDTLANKPNGDGAYTWSAGNNSIGILTGSAMLSQDLSNDHPIGIPYCGGLLIGSCKDDGFNGTGAGGYVETTGDSTKSKSDFPLFGLGNTTVECASCHDVHAGEKTAFLRLGNNDGSKMCLACHNK